MQRVQHYIQQMMHGFIKEHLKQNMEVKRIFRFLHVCCMAVF